jgi:hypothetical protein
VQSKSVTIRVRSLDGEWEVIGVDRLRGVWPENDSYTSDEHGSSKCSFDLRRDPGGIFPDLVAFTPIEVESGGVIIWSGFIGDTPVREGDHVFNVQGRGWQYHLDDDVYQRTYLANRLSDFKDSRSLPSADLNIYRAAGNVSNDTGLVIGWGVGDSIANTTRVGVTFDMGPGNTCAQVLYEVTYRNAHTTSMDFLITGTVSSESPLAGDVIAIVQTTIVGGTAETAAALAGQSVSTPCRYIHVSLKNVGGDTAASAGEVYARLRSIGLVADAAYQSGGVSTLTSDKILNDALDRATLLFNSDRSGIQVPTFAHPSFALDGQKTPREVGDACNAVQDWLLQVDVNRRVIFAPKPSAPRLEIGAWPGSTFDDASANSGDEIYNRVIVEGTGPDKGKVSVQRMQAQQAGVLLEVLSTPAADNPSFATNTTSWTASAGTTITRDTGVFDTTPASGRWDNGGAPGGTLTETFTGTFLPGAVYLLTFRMRFASVTIPPTLTATLGDSRLTRTTTVAGAFATWGISWAPTLPSSSVTLTLTQVNKTGAAAIYIDSLILSAAKPTLVDRRGFRRTHVLPVKNTLTSELGQQIGDVWLAAHKTTPLKGTVVIEGDAATREILTGVEVPPERLLLATGELLRLSDRLDPDTGGQGRDGRIAEVTYDPVENKATVAIDSRRTSQEALLERMSVVIGSA